MFQGPAGFSFRSVVCFLSSLCLSKSAGFLACSCVPQVGALRAGFLACRAELTKSNTAAKSERTSTCLVF